MFVYIVILCFLLLLSSFNVRLKISPKLAQELYFLIFAVLFLFSGLRYEVGMDYGNYEYMYEQSVLYQEDMREVGWASFFYIFRNAGIPFEYVVLLLSFVTMMLAFSFIRRYSPFIFLSVLIFFCFGQYYFNTFNAVRQTLAAYAFFFALKYVYERKMVAYFLFMGMVALCIHFSAIFLIPFYFILHREYPFYLKVGVWLFFMLGAEFLVRVIALSNYALYLETDRFSSEVALTTYFLIGVAFFFLLTEHFIKNKTREWVVLLNISFVGLLFLSMCVVFENTPLIVIFNRFSYYFTPVYIVLIPMLVGKLQRPVNQSVCIVLISVVYSLLCCQALIYNGEKNRTVPYQTILSK